MGLRATAVRLRVDARRPASWIGIAIGAGLTWWLAGEPREGTVAAAVLAGALAAAGAVGVPPDGGVGWAAIRAAWPAAGAVLAWLARGAALGAVEAPAAVVASCAGTALAVTAVRRAGFAPADAVRATVWAAAAGSLGAAVTWALGLRSVATTAAAVTGWGAALTALVVVRRFLAAEGGPRRGPDGTTMPRAVTVSALAGMLLFLLLAPHLAAGYLALAAAWLVADAAPRAALGPGPEGDAARRRLGATTPGCAARPARAAWWLAAAYAAVLAWPPLVAAAVAGSPTAACGPLGIAVAIGAGAAVLAAVAAGSLAAGASRETALALTLGAALVVLAAGGAAAARAGFPDRPPPRTDVEQSG